MAGNSSNVGNESNVYISEIVMAAVAYVAKARRNGWRVRAMSTMALNNVASCGNRLASVGSLATNTGIVWPTTYAKAFNPVWEGGRRFIMLVSDVQCYTSNPSVPSVVLFC